MFLLFSIFQFCIVIVFGNTNVVKDRTLRFVAKKSFDQIKGIETRNFLELLKSDFYFDKTIILEKTIVNSFKYKTILITLPSKWGKTINLNMMKTFFEIQVDELGNRIPLENTTNYRLFRKNELVDGKDEIQKLAKPLYISENENILMKYQGQYPVIYLDFHNVSGSSYEDFMRQVANKIKDAFTRHIYLINVLKQEFNTANTTKIKNKAKEKHDFFLNILSEQVNYQDLIKSLKFLTEVLHDHFNAKVFILVDNYEDIILNGLVNDAISESELQLSLILDFYSSLMLKTLQLNDYLQTGILTGTLQMLNLVQNLTSVIEHMECYDMMTTSYGIIHENLLHIFKYFRIPSNLSSKAINWYKGYRRGARLTHNLYSPHSIMNFISKKKPDYYKTRHVVIDPILETILDNGKTRISTLWLIYGEAVLSPRKTRSDTIFNNFFQLKKFLYDKESRKKEDYPVMFNIFQSYLRGIGTLALKSFMGDLGSTLRIPNNEVRMEVSDKLMNLYMRKFKISSELLEKAIENMASFISGRDLNATNLITFLKSLITNTALMDNLAQGRKYDQQTPELFYCFVFNYLTYRIVLSHEYQIQPIDEIKSNNWILYTNQSAVFIQFRFNSSADQVLSVCRNHASTTKFSKLEELRFIGINIQTKGEVRIKSEFQKGPVDSDHTPEPKSQEEVCFSPYSCYKPVIFPK